MAPYRLGVPAREVEDTMRSRGWRLAPGMLPLVMIASTVGRTLELCLRQQARVSPAGIGRGLRIADVNRPGERQRQNVEHAAPLPRTALVLPEQRMANIVFSQPRPIFRSPPTRL